MKAQGRWASAEELSGVNTMWALDGLREGSQAYAELMKESAKHVAKNAMRATPRDG